MALRISMRILALNSGSSSLKYRIFDSDKSYLEIEKGSVERIGQSTSTVSFSDASSSSSMAVEGIATHSEAMATLFATNGQKLQNIEAAGHRVVHGGKRFRTATLIDEKVTLEIGRLAQFAPLHSAPNLVGIETLRRLLPNIPHVAVFDTSAHRDMEFKAFAYALPAEYYEKYNIRKYGFHGLSHSHMAHETAKILNRPLESLKIVTCHLGNGSSISAFEKGKSIDNSMGLTPVEGLVMGSRCGDLDPSIPMYLMDSLGLSSKEVQHILNKKSGLLGLCGRSDMRDIIAAAEQGDFSAARAIEVFVYRALKYIGGYIAALNGIDAIAFTGGIGENSPHIRSLIAQNLSYLRAHVDDDKNKCNATIFSKESSSVFLITLPANEEKMIAQETHRVATSTRHLFEI